MNKTFREIYKSVTDEATFLQFIKALAEDRRNAVKQEKAKPSSPFGPDAGGWENTTIEDYLEAGVSWAEDSDFGRRMAFKELELNNVSPWKRIAAFMMAARIYE